MFSEEFMLKTAGAVEMQKWAKDYKLGKRPTPYVPESWRPIIVPVMIQVLWEEALFMKLVGLMEIIRKIADGLLEALIIISLI